MVADKRPELDELVDVLRDIGLRPDVMLGTDFLPEVSVGYDVVVARSEAVEKLARLRQQLAPGGVLVALLPQTAGLSDVVACLREAGCGHVLRGEPGWPELLTATLVKLVSGEIFGLERYLPPETKLHLLRFQTYKGRSAAIDKIVRYAKKSGFRGGLRQAIAQATEELLMNALYSAPVDGDGRLVFGDVLPKDRLSMESPKPVSVRFAVAGDAFGIAVRDRYGKFSKDTLSAYLAKCLRQDETQIDTKVSGAGLGLYFVASRASLFVYNVAEGVATEAIALFDKSRASAGVPKGMGMFLYAGEPR